MQTEQNQNAEQPNAQALGTESAPAEENQPAAPSNDGTTEASAASEEGAQAQGQEGTPPRKTNAEKRIGKLTKKVSEASRRAEYWEQEARRLQSQNLPPPAPAAPNAPQGPSKEPVLADFETYAAYTNALVDWKVEQRELIRERRAEEARARETVESSAKTYQEKLREFTKAKPDFTDRLAAVSDVQMPVALQERLRKAGPEVIYEMMDDPDEFRRVCSMEIGDAVEEIGRVKDRLKAAAKPPEEQQQQQPKPKPPTPVGSKVTPVKDWKKMSIREYDEWRRKGNIPTG